MMKLRNIMEIIVKKEVEQSKHLLELACQCDQCLADIMAISLNQYPPKYIVNDDLEPYVRVGYEMMQQERAGVLTAIVNAAKKVNQNPRCKGNEFV